MELSMKINAVSQLYDALTQLILISAKICHVNVKQNDVSLLIT